MLQPCSHSNNIFPAAAHTLKFEDVQVEHLNTESSKGNILTEHRLIGSAAAICCHPCRASKLLHVSNKLKQAEEAGAIYPVSFESLPVAAQLAQRVASNVKGVQARAAGN